MFAIYSFSFWYASSRTAAVSVLSFFPFFLLGNTQKKYTHNANTTTIPLDAGFLGNPNKKTKKPIRCTHNGMGNIQKLRCLNSFSLPKT
jgi:hypothetical protein